MRHVLYSLFNKPTEADAALHELHAAGLSQQVCNLVVHRGGVRDTDLHDSEREGRQGLAIGLIMGVVAGAILGWLLVGPLHLLHMGLLQGLAFGAMAGVIFGGLAGGLYGSGLPDKNLTKMAEDLKDGQVLITAEVEGLSTEDTVAQIFRRHGAMPAPKAVV